MWLWKKKEILDEDLVGFKSFVYLITCTVNGKKYIGKKKLQFTRRKPIKNSRYKKTVVKESDWREYYGSSEWVAKDIVKFGKESFTREILYLCKTNPEATYLELKEQVINDVLLKPAEYYNNYVGARIHRKHVLKKDE